MSFPIRFSNEDKIFSDSSKFKKVAVMIPYKDGLSILENLEDADGKLTMTISKGVSLIVLEFLTHLNFQFGIKNHESLDSLHKIVVALYSS